MKQHSDRAIVLGRIDYGEKDRILTLLCREQGKVSVLAKSVRSPKSRLAGGIELLSESDVSYIDGKSNLKALTGARLRTHFDAIMRDMRRMQLAFDCIKAVNGIIEENTGQEYYDPLLAALAAFNDHQQDYRVVDIWFSMHVLAWSGSAPNLNLDAAATEDADRFNFDYDHQQFVSNAGGQYTRNDLKLLRVCASQNKPPKLSKPTGSEDRLEALVKLLLKNNVTEV